MERPEGHLGLVLGPIADAQRYTMACCAKRMEEAAGWRVSGTTRPRAGPTHGNIFLANIPELLADGLGNMSDRDIWRLNRGGHDPHKIYAAYHQAGKAHREQPTVILAKTVKGYGHGPRRVRRQNITHQLKKMDERIHQVTFVTGSTSRWRMTELDERSLLSSAAGRTARRSRYMKQSRVARRWVDSCLNEDRSVPSRYRHPAWTSLRRRSYERPLEIAKSARRWHSCAAWPIILRNKGFAEYVSCPSCADEARTFGMEGHVPAVGYLFVRSVSCIHPMDSDQLMFYKEDLKEGQILQEGITEAGAMSRPGFRQPPAMPATAWQHGALLHLLFDVRVSENRRPLPGRPVICQAPGAF